MQFCVPQSHQLPPSEWPANATLVKGIESVDLLCVCEAIKGRTAIRNKQANILFIPTSIGGNGAEVQGTLSDLSYRQLIYSSLARSANKVEELEVLGQHVAAIARNAWAAKDLNAVEHASQVMLAMPVADQRETARYYRALCTWWRDDRENARQSLARVVVLSPHLRSRALHAIGLTYHESGEIDAALPFYLKAGKRVGKGDLLTLLESQRIAAVIRSIHGDHDGALADIERLFPLVRATCTASPVLYYECLNSLGVEMSEVGHIAEAEAALSIALASPYPEWRATREEIAAKHKFASPSIVAIHHATEGERTPKDDRTPKADPARQVDPAPEVERAIETESQRKLKASRSLALSSPPSNKGFFQRTTSTIQSTTTITLNATSILDRVLICIGPRAPRQSPDSMHKNIKPNQNRKMGRLL